MKKSTVILGLFFAAAVCGKASHSARAAPAADIVISWKSYQNVGTATMFPVFRRVLKSVP
ncbi:MAG: hypothetical protein ABSE56_14170 [Bryobacteraceae bacterium]